MFDAMKIKLDIVRWIRDYFKNNGENCPAIVGISGGKDSSIVAALCVEAIGASRVVGVLLPQGEQHDINTSMELVEFLGIKHFTVNIKSCVDALIASVNDAKLTLDNQAKINTPARVRMAALYAIAATFNARVANTCNFSEDYVGYSTKFGDNAGDFSPLARLTVTEIKAIGRALGLPSKFVDKTPEDGLTGLSDEENLGFSYDVLDRYIRNGICENQSIKTKIDALHKQNRHKQEQMPCYNLLN